MSEDTETEIGVPLRTDGSPIRQDLVDELTTLLRGDRDAGLTIPELIEREASSQDIVVERAKRFEEGSRWEVSWDGGISCVLDYDGEIEVGDTLTMYPGAQLGDRRYGWAINGELVEWATPWERLVRELEWWAQRDRRNREDYERLKPEMDAAYEALPDELKDRIDRFRDADPNFRMNDERYEMAATGDAPKIAAALQPQIEALEISRDDDEEEWLDAVAKIFDAFREQPWETSREMVPDLQEGHSGNTFGGAVALGYRFACGLDV